MKRLAVFATVAALVLSFASCGGNLHDADYIYLGGGIASKNEVISGGEVINDNNCIAVEVNDNAFELKFIYKGDGWGQPEGNNKFFISEIPYGGIYGTGQDYWNQVNGKSRWAGGTIKVGKTGYFYLTTGGTGGDTEVAGILSGMKMDNEYTLTGEIGVDARGSIKLHLSGNIDFYLIGNEDFGMWNWSFAKTMTRIAEDEWIYEFTAAKSEAEFKFQTSNDGWNDGDTWNAKKEIIVDGEYTSMENGAGGSNMSAKLEVGKKYKISVKSNAEKYDIKISSVE